MHKPSNIGIADNSRCKRKPKSLTVVGFFGSLYIKPMRMVAGSKGKLGYSMGNKAINHGLGRYLSGA